MTSREAHVVTHFGFHARLFLALMDDGDLSFSSCGSDHLKGLVANTYDAGFFGSTHLFTLASAERFLSLSTPLCYSAVQVVGYSQSPTACKGFAVSKLHGKRRSRNEREEWQPQEFQSCGRDSLRVQMPAHCIKQLDEIKNELKLRSHGRAVNWLLPEKMKGLVELTEVMGYTMGGQTIDWLLSMGMGTERILNFKQVLDSQNGGAGQAVNLSLPSETRPLVELTRELGFNRGGETVDWLLEMATDPLLKLISSLGFKSGAKTIDWLLNKAQPSITAAKMNGFNLHKPPRLSSAMNIPPQFPPRQLETPGKKTQFHNFNAERHHQFQSTGQLFVENQQQIRFHGDSSGHQAEYQSFNGNGGLSNRFEGIKRRRMEAGYSNHVGNPLQGQHPSWQQGSQARTHTEIATGNPAQDFSQNPINGVDEGGAPGFERPTYSAGMPLEIHTQNKFPNPKSPLDYYFYNQNQFENVHAQNQNQFVNIPEQNHNQNQFVNIHDHNQNQFINIREHNMNQFVNIHGQNEGGIQAEGNYGGYAVSSLSNEDQEIAGTVNDWFANVKAL